MGAPRIALVWHRADDQPKQRRRRLDGVMRALEARGAVAPPVLWSDDAVDAVRAELRRADGVLVWVNPLTGGHDRTALDGMLRDVAEAGVFVSAHPDVVARLGTKEVLHRTRSLGWSTDVALYGDGETLRRGLAARLAGGPRVVKRLRGNDGLGVYKIELASPGVVRCEHAYDGAVEQLSLDALCDRFAPYLASGGRLVDQAFVPRVAEGMVRCYVSGRTVAGFAEHLPRGLVAAGAGTPGLGHDKVMHDPDAPRFQRLRAALEHEWIPGMQRLLGLDDAALPAVWDADFLRGAGDAWVLCEINASCVSPFPGSVAPAIADTTLARVRAS